MDWQLQDAKNHFSKVVAEGAQRRAADRHAAWRAHGRGGCPPATMTLCAGRPTLVDDLLGGPPWDDELADAIEARAKTPSRGVAF